MSGGVMSGHCGPTSIQLGHNHGYLLPNYRELSKLNKFLAKKLILCPGEKLFKTTLWAPPRLVLNVFLGERQAPPSITMDQSFFNSGLNHHAL